MGERLGDGDRQGTSANSTRWKENRAIADRVIEFNISCRDQFLCRRKHTVEQCRAILGYD